jgi:hypothetical protein
MTCFNPEPIYANPPFRGVKRVASRGNGSIIDVEWYKAIPHSDDWTLAYNIYYSSIREDVFAEGVKYVCINPDQVESYIPGLAPGDVYYIAVRGTEWDSDIIALSQLPDGDNGCKVYPEGQLRSNISDEALRIPVQDADTFPPKGIVQLHAELIIYNSLDLVTDELVLSSLAGRGAYGTFARMHTVDGYDGYRRYPDSIVRHFTGFDDNSGAVETEETNIKGQYARTVADGYKNIDQSLVQTDLSMVEASNEDFNSWDYAGWRRTAPDDLLSGKCVGSYYGGEHYCADGYDGIGRQVRGLTFQDHNNQREELLLSTTGEPVILLRRMMEGKTSLHYRNTIENTAYRGLDNFGTHMVTGYDQYYNPKRSDGKILVRFGPTVEDYERQDGGIENKFIPDCWTLVTPVLKDSDIIIRFNEDGTEEFRYEVANVTRNRTVLEESGAQKFSAIRIRKTDPVYQWRAIRDTSTIPTNLNTSMGGVAGPGGIPPHMHAIVVNEGITMLSQVNQTTSVVQGHNHPIVNGIVTEVLGHTHTIML